MTLTFITPTQGQINIFLCSPPNHTTFWNIFYLLQFSKNLNALFKIRLYIANAGSILYVYRYTKVYTKDIIWEKLLCLAMSNKINNKKRA